MLKVTALFKEYSDADHQTVQAAQNITFEVPQGTLFTLLGPSGCGKTTTLRSIAGLEKPDSGQISIEKQILYSSEKKISVPPNRRNFGMVFQSYAIWPHMNVFENVAFPLQTGDRRFSKNQIQDKVTRALQTVALETLETREATKLSGGQQQRLALARALVTEPRLLLLDEPLSNLDAKLRERMQIELKRLQQQLGITTVYVTHDQNEALALSHRIGVMNEGRIVQIGSPQEIYEHPANRFVADFVGVTNLLEGTIESECRPQTSIQNGYYYRVQTDLGQITVFASNSHQTGEHTVISIRPQDVHPLTQRPNEDGFWEATVETILFLGEWLNVRLRVGETFLQARVHPGWQGEARSTVYVKIDPERCTIIER